MNASDIRWSTLSNAEHGGHDEHDEGEAEIPYDEVAFK